MEEAADQAALIDTDILIDASRGLIQAGVLLNDMLRGPGVSTSAISAMELIAGCRDSASLSRIKQLLGQFTIVPLTPAVSERAQTLMETYILSHGLALPDALIAATALESGIALYTRNVRHFGMIPELLVIQPY